MPQSYKIPQNVDLEDKILGPFTLKQFLYMLGAGLLTFVNFSVWYTALPSVFYILTLFVWAAAGAFVFVRPNDQPFSKFITSFVSFMLKPQRRVWRRLPTLEEITLHDSTAEVPVNTADEPSAEEIRSRLAKLAHVVDTRGWSTVDESAGDVAGRVAAGEAQPKYNLGLTDSEQPEDILAREDEHAGSDRASSELERVLKHGIPKPHLRHDVRRPQAARPTEG